MPLPAPVHTPLSEVSTNYQIIVAGGGFAGCCAAIAAGRLGARVLLLEASGSLGGAAVQCLVNPFMPHKTRVPGKKEGETEPVDLTQGLFAEICARLRDESALGPDQCSPFSEEHLKLVLDDMVSDAGVDVLFHAVLASVDNPSGHIASVQVATKAGLLSLSADLFIDCTGDADLAAFAGCPFHLGRSGDSLCQPMTLCFRLGGIDTEAFYKNRAAIQAKYKEWQSEGRTNNPREDVLYFRTLNRGVVHFNTTRVVKLDPTNPFDVSRAERAARRQMRELFEMLRASFDFCKDAELLHSAASIGVRESRMIDGEHVITSEELKDCVRYPDAVAAGNYDIDIHNPEGSGTSHYYFPEGRYYTLPYRALLPKKADNLLVAGRCISSTHEAQASYRIMPIVACLGEAAGTAAALAMKTGATLRSLDIPALQAQLRAQGAFIG